MKIYSFMRYPKTFFVDMQIVWLKQNRGEVAKQPRIAEYLKNGPATLFKNVNCCSFVDDFSI